ncbi:ABC transporter permease [Paraburkholderia phenoliruptrix]|uniref:Octopine transport system permease protein n=2 Tax=Paraburkholderia phenoliruptrix TaxID=252970 RepID=K0E3P1_9BURK|nr:ABC transporter permease subunit [Paraburkholderia phenoliruptrix]AFT90479.1 Octopine transport system permease protein [Paraburkholderia phenoliruptrix BR3459a]CAB4051890.1 Octopine transport system permease protein OccQ [Paraburkholderia phenoliruptrix]
MEYYQFMGFGNNGWGRDMLAAAGVSVAVALCGFVFGLIFGCLGAFASLSRARAFRLAASSYTTALRGIPDLLVIYLLYFGSSSVLSMVGELFGSRGFVGAPAFLTGALSLGILSGAYQTHVLRGAVLSLNKGEIEAGRACGMSSLLLFRRIVLPQAARYALPGVGNVWQLVLKESALISVIGLAELMRQAQVGSGSTNQPFSFYLTAAALYLLITFVSGQAFRIAEARGARGLRRSI